MGTLTLERPRALTLARPRTPAEFDRLDLREFEPRVVDPHILSTRRRFLRLSGGTLAAGVLAGCGADAPGTAAASGWTAGDLATAGNGETIQVLYPNNPAFDSTLESMLGADFTAQTSVTVELIQATANYDEVNRRIQNDLTAGQVSELAVLALHDIRTFADAGVAQPLDEFIRLSPDYAQQIYPEFLNFGKRDGRTYAIPFAASVLVMFYNADLLRAAGLDPDRPPQTFTELAAAARALVGSGAAKYGAAWPYDIVGAWPYQTFLGCADGSYMSADEQEVTFDSPQGVEILTFWRDLVEEGLWTPLGNDDSQQALLSGELGIYIASSSQLVAYQEGSSFDLRTAPSPIPDGSTRRLPAGGAGLVMLTQDRARQAAAWHGIQALTGVQGSTALTQNSGYLAVNRTAAEDPDGLGGFLSADPLREAAASQVPFIVPWYQFPGTNTTEISQLMQDAMLAALNGSKPVDQALTDAKNAVESLLP